MTMHYPLIRYYNKKCDQNIDNIDLLIDIYYRILFEIEESQSCSTILNRFIHEIKIPTI